MESKLYQHIQEFGGKHGSLLYFRENVEGGADRVLPFEILSPGENFSWGTRRKVWAACKDFNTEKVIVRTSEQSDWNGMVDTMPTIISAQDFFGVRKVVETIRRKCHDPALLEFARKEGNGYDPSKVTVSVSPYLSPSSHPRTLVTQHPNDEDARLVDVSTPYGLTAGHFRHQSFDFKASGKMHYVYGSQNMVDFARDSLKVSSWIERSHQLPDSQAFQFEGAVFRTRDSQSPKLFQIRSFAEKRAANFQVKGDKDFFLMRKFGITPPEGVELKVVKVSTRDQFARFEDRNPGVPYLLVVEDTTAHLRLSDQPMNMRAYFPDFKPALSHEATRMLQMVLKDPHGVASLISSRGSEKLQDGRTVRVISDGVRQTIE